jgi:hypothetical protein
LLFILLLCELSLSSTATNTSLLPYGWVHRRSLKTLLNHPSSSLFLISCACIHILCISVHAYFLSCWEIYLAETFTVFEVLLQCVATIRLAYNDLSYSSHLVKTDPAICWRYMSHKNAFNEPKECTSRKCKAFALVLHSQISARTTPLTNEGVYAESECHSGS